jgi:hypothetical protein
MTSPECDDANASQVRQNRLRAGFATGCRIRTVITA